MRYLVTGGAGFIGSNTVDELVRRGHKIGRASCRERVYVLV